MKQFGWLWLEYKLQFLVALALQLHPLKEFLPPVLQDSLQLAAHLETNVFLQAAPEVLVPHLLTARRKQLHLLGWFKSVLLEKFFWWQLSLHLCEHLVTNLFLQLAPSSSDPHLSTERRKQLHFSGFFTAFQHISLHLLEHLETNLSLQSFWSAPVPHLLAA